MNTTRHEHISALMDGELSDSEIEQLLIACKGSALSESWNVYQQIGDVLRSDDLAINLSAGFSERFSALLDAEPVLVAPQNKVRSEQATNVGALERPRNEERSWTRRVFAMGGMAALAATVFIVVQQLNPVASGRGDVSQLARVAAEKSTAGVETVSATATIAEAPQSGDVNAIQQESGDMLRDPRIDSYLLAHQKFSPAISKGTRYVNHDATTGADK